MDHGPEQIAALPETANAPAFKWLPELFRRSFWQPHIDRPDGSVRIPLIDMLNCSQWSVLCPHNLLIHPFSMDQRKHLTTSVSANEETAKRLAT